MRYAVRRARDRGPARIAQAQHRGDFVERLACRVVDRAAQIFKICRRQAAVKARVPAADDQPHAGEKIAPRRHAARIDVGLQVIDGDERLAGGRTQRLGGHQSHEK